ncbi:hypothetical protein SAMN05519103_09490 [Rhizobiales bacterium GAS113]|nr:hypothetical protein SAMN05519103_09490 [Rhizobiales bacterium GAS113]
MKRFTDAGRRSLAEGNLYAALSLALTLPDICGSLEDPGPNKSHVRYVRWFKKWAEPEFTSVGHVYVSAEDCYQIRCSLVHSGTAEIERRRRTALDRFEFFDDTCGAHLTWVEGITVNGVLQPNFLQLKARNFSDTIYDATDNWDASTKADNAIQAEKAKLLVIHSRGAALGGVHFG